MIKLIIAIDCDECGLADTYSSEDTDLAEWQTVACDLAHVAAVGGSWISLDSQFYCPDCWSNGRPSRTFTEAQLPPKSWCPQAANLNCQRRQKGLTPD
ncbi:MAG: hypothetical protein K2X77_23025, partial [Candidatus Obscuribacterales bacterium]|nr:hypothetical protein [Candidatus Obscuribacterales bacterium]